VKVAPGAGAGAASRVLLVASCGLLAIAVSDLFVQWVLYTEALARRFLYGA
jgi:hypothetical protein